MKCNRCDNNTAVYTRKYSGEKLCSECFSNSILKKTAKTISKYNMIQNDELVAVAVSGGKDSLALLKIINHMAQVISLQIEDLLVGLILMRMQKLHLKWHLHQLLLTLKFSLLCQIPLHLVLQNQQIMQ